MLERCRLGGARGFGSAPSGDRPLPAAQGCRRSGRLWSPGSSGPPLVGNLWLYTSIRQLQQLLLSIFSPKSED